MKKRILLIAAFAFFVGNMAANAQITAFFGDPNNPGDVISIGAKPVEGWGFVDIDTVSLRSYPAVCWRGAGNDTLACGPVLDNAFANKIAVIYRSPVIPDSDPRSCGFGEKALNAQRRGAKGVILINSLDKGINIGMLPADSGFKVTIPVVMIDVAEGRRFISRLCAGEMVSLGTLVNKFNFNLHIDGNMLSVFPYKHYPNDFYGTAAAPRQDLNQNIFRPEVRVANIGRQAVAGATIQVKVEREFSGITETLLTGSDLIANLSQYSTGRTPGDTGSFIYPKFDAAAYPYNSAGTREGKYTITYELVMPTGVVDQYLADNKFVASAFIGPKYLSTSSLAFNGIYAKAKAKDFSRVAVGAYRIGVSFESYDNPVQVDSLGVAVQVAPEDDITQESAALEIYEWDDANEDGLVSDAEIANLIGSGNLDFSDPSSNGQFQTVAVRDIANNGIVILPPNKTYIMMFNYQGPIEFTVAFENDYDLSVVGTQDSIIRGRDNFRALCPLNDPARQWFVGYQSGSSVAMVASLQVPTSSRAKLSAIDARIYPMPATDEITLSLPKNVDGSLGSLEISDLAGKVLYSSAQVLKVNTKIATNNLTNGIYQLKVMTKTGATVRKFSIVR